MLFKLTDKEKEELGNLVQEVKKEHDALEKKISEAIQSYEAVQEKLSAFCRGIEIDRQEDLDEVDFFYDQITLEIINFKAPLHGKE